MKLVYNGKEISPICDGNNTLGFTIEITTPPTRTQYYSGDKFDSAGMVVQGKFENGFTVDIPHEYLTFSPSDELDESNTSITINFENVTAQQEISVKPIPDVAWLSPKMTSNNAPIPYKCGASSYATEFGSSPPYCAFDNNYETFWANKVSDSNTHIWIDFGNTRTIKGFRMMPRARVGNVEPLTQIPITYTIEISDNGTNWDVIYQRSNLPSPTNVEWVIDEFDIYISTRYFRISNMLSNWKDGPKYIGIADIEFLIS